MVSNSSLPKISESVCQQVISSKFPSETFTVLSYEQSSVAELNGYLGEHSILSVTIDRHHTKETFRFFVKSHPQVQSQQTFLLEINGWFKEKQFFTKYQSLLKQYSIDILDGAIPICHFVNEELFVFEDLASKGYVTLPSRTPLSVDCVKKALTTLAKLHASGLVLEELKAFRLPDEFAEELRESFYLGTKSTEAAMGSAKSGVRALIDLTHGEQMKLSKRDFTEKALEGCELQKAFARPLTLFRNTVCHADLWTKNFMFEFEKGEAVNCVLVDFQTYRYGPPAQDVLSFIYLVTDRATRSGRLDELLRFYYDRLRENFGRFGLEAVVTEREFFQSCDYFSRFALTQNLLHFQVVILSDEVGRELFSQPDYARAVLFDDKYDFFKDTCGKDPVFRHRNFEVIEELRKFYEKQLTDEFDNE